MKTRIQNSDPKNSKKTEVEKFCSKSVGTVKMKVKGGAAVDPGLDKISDFKFI